MEYYVTQQLKKTDEGRFYGGFTEYRVWKKIEKYKLELIYEYTQDYQGVARKPTRTRIGEMKQDRTSAFIQYRDGPATDKHRFFYVPMKKSKMMDIYVEAICKNQNIEI